MKFPDKKHMNFPGNLDCSPHVYYSRLLGPFYRAKIKMLCNLLPLKKEAKILEIGFGAGIALKELSARFTDVYAIDIHNHIAEVEQMLKKEKITNVRLFLHDIFKEPFYKDINFDYIISSSLFEHIRPEVLNISIKNIHSILKKDGFLLLGFPLKTTTMNILFLLYEKIYRKINRCAYNFSVKTDHPSGEKEIISAIEKYFTVEQKRYFFNNFLKAYVTLKCRKIALQ